MIAQLLPFTFGSNAWPEGPRLVRFMGVGRTRESWEEQLPNLSDAAILQAVRQRVQLMSSELDVTYDDALATGTIYAGMGHAIGSFQVSALSA